MNIIIDYGYNYSEQIGKLEKTIFNVSFESIYKADRDIRAVMYTDNDIVLGFLTFKVHESSVEIYNLAVEQKYRRNKIGSKLLDVIKYYTSSLEVRKSNKTAIKFYEKSGFKQIGIRKNYYQDEDAIVLERKKTMIDKAYAKINLVLNVKQKLDSGYHEIEFLMNSINLYDTVNVTESERDQVIVTNNENLSGFDNLAYRALEEIRNQFAIKTKYKIEITKNIPIAAGMAGGSSDAASVLRCINKLENLQLSDEQLALIGARVGSDVSFCVHSKLAIATGTGENIELVTNELPRKYILVANPGVSLSTKEVYENHIINDIKGDPKAVIAADSDEQFANSLANSLEPTAYRLCPEMNELRDYIKEHTNNKILVSGSGPTLLVFSSEEAEIDTLYEKIKLRYKQTFKAIMN